MVSGIVGLDLSLKSTGVARKNIRDGESGDIFFYWAIAPDEKMTRLQRIHEIWMQIFAIVERSDLVFIEDYAFAKSNTLAWLGELGGVIKWELQKRTGLEPFVVSIGTWKKFLCNNGSLKKDEFKLRVYQKFDLDVKTNDEAAAIAICDVGMHIARGEHDRKLTKYEKSVIAKYRKDNPGFAQALARRKR